MRGRPGVEPSGGGLRDGRPVLAEFGTIAVGARADLLLLDRDPLESLSALDRPAGVMARGRWLPQGRLEEMLSGFRLRGQ
jgi:hypothetical protein